MLYNFRVLFLNNSVYDVRLVTMYVACTQRSCTSGANLVVVQGVHSCVCTYLTLFWRCMRRLFRGFPWLCPTNKWPASCLMGR